MYGMYRDHDRIPRTFVIFGALVLLLAVGFLLAILGAATLGFFGLLTALGLAGLGGTILVGKLFE